MKNSYSFWALIAVSFLFAFSCQKNEVALEDEHPSEKSFRTITLNFPTDPETKVSLAEDGKTAWEENDEILIHGAKVGKNGDVYYSRIITLKSENIHNSGKTATFTLEDIEADAGWGRSGYKATLFAAYPASALIDYTDGDWWYYSSAWDQTNTLLMAGTNDTSVNDGNTFTFTHLTGVLSFVVSGDFDSYIFSGKSGTEVVGYDVFSVRVDTQSKFGDKNKIPYNGGSGGVGFSGEKTSITAPVVSDGSTINYIYFPGGVNLANGFTIQFMKGGIEQKRIETNTAKNIERGKYLKLGDVTAYLHTYVPPATHDSSIDMTGATDLSASTSANSYIVDGSVLANANKVFTFKAYKGKSTTKVSDIYSASIVWETYNNSETVIENSVIAAVDYDKQAENDYYTIVFKMPETLHSGNALIAAKNKKGDILWSWHIWVPASTIETNTYSIYNHALMDRYLGALVAATPSSVPVESFGLHYEWGRKDPFLGARSITSSDFATRSGTPLSVDYEMTVAQTIANPATYAVYTSSDSWGPWLNPNDNTLWKNDEKTMYDPCPAGYRVPKRDQDQPLHSSDLSAVVGWSDNAAAGDNAAYFTLGDPVTVFPYGGLVCENGEYIDYPGGRSFVWTAYCSSNPYIMDVRLGGNHKLSSTVTSRGCSIRCCVDE